MRLDFRGGGDRVRHRFLCSLVRRGCAALEAALRRAQGSVILAAFNQRLTSEVHDHRIVTNRPLDRFSKQSWPGSVNVHPDPDGQVRYFSYGEVIDGDSVPSIAAIFGGSPVRSGAFPIDFSIQGRALERISVVDLLQGRITKQQVAGKKIIVGATAIELRDYHQVPAQGLISGAVMQAIAAETLLQGRVLAEPGRVSAHAGLALFALLVILARRIDWKIRLLGFISAAIAIEAAAAILQARYAVALNTSAWHVMLMGSAVLTIGLEIGLRRVLLAISNTEARILAFCSIKSSPTTSTGSSSPIATASSIPSADRPSGLFGPMERVTGTEASAGACAEYVGQFDDAGDCRCL